MFPQGAFYPGSGKTDLPDYERLEAATAPRMESASIGSNSPRESSEGAVEVMAVPKNEEEEGDEGEEDGSKKERSDDDDDDDDDYGMGMAMDDFDPNQVSERVQDLLVLKRV